MDKQRRLMKVIHKIIQKNGSEKSSGFKREHIFYDLKKIISKKCDQNSLMDMYYHFCVYEKILNFSRSENLVISKYWIDRIEKKQKFLPKEIRDPLDILYLPAIAYYEYKLGNKEIALDLLNRELFFVKSYLSDYGILRVEYIIECYINIIRVYWNFKEYDNFKTASKKLLLFILSDVKKDEIFYDESTVDLERNKDNYLNLIEYVINSIFFKIINEKTFSKDKKTIIVKEILSPLFEYLPLFVFNNKILTIKHHFDSKKDEFQNYLIESFEEDELFPISMQFYLLNIYIDNYSDNSQQINELFNLYFDKRIFKY